MSVTAASGFLAAGVAAGIKPDGALDTCLVIADRPAQAAAVFTTSRAPAPPVIVSRRHVAAGPEARAVLVTSGCANAGTGPAGERVARASTEVVARLIDRPAREVLVCSTGPIGPLLDLEKVERGVHLAHDALASTPEAGTAAAEAMMTTDSVPKEAAARHPSGFTVGGMTKGAGMIRPDMATMLAILTTDAAIDPHDLDLALRSAVDRSFHALDIDGCSSTNDTVMLLATGASGTRASAVELADPLTDVCWSLAEQIARDAEGATRMVRIEVRGAASDETARRLGRAIADWALVRASFYGGDPNWGRILGALGAAPEMIDPDRISVAYEDVVVARNGMTVPCDEDALAARIATGDFTVRVAVGDGPGEATVLTTDLTPDYVRFNGERS